MNNLNDINVKISVKDLMSMATTIYDEYERPHKVVEVETIKRLADIELAKDNLNDPDLKDKVLVGFGVID